MSVRIQDATTLNKLKVNADGSINAQLVAEPTIDIGLVDQGTPGTSANGWPVKPTDGTNSQSFTASGEAKVDVTTTVLPPGASTAAKQDTGNTSVASIDTKTPSLVSGRVPVDGSGVTQPVSASSLPLPTGASTSSLQGTGNTSLSSIDTKTPALGQALAAGSTPVVLPIAQITTLTPPTTVTVTQGTGTNLHTAVDSLPSLPAGSNAIGTVGISNFPSTQAVSAASLPLPTGASTSALQTTGNTSLGSIDTKLPAQGQALAAASIPVVLPAAQITTLTPPSTVTAKLQDGSGNSLGSYGGAMYVVGEDSAGTMNTARVMTVQGAGIGSIAMQTNVLSSVLPTGAATSANQASELAVLNTIATNTGSAATDFFASGTITGTTGSVVVTGQGVYTISIAVSGTWSGASLPVQGQMPDGSWVSLPVFTVGSSLPYQASFGISTNGNYIVTGGGYQNVRVYGTGYVSGTVNVALEASLAQQTIFSAQLGTWLVTSQTPDITSSGSITNTQAITLVLNGAKGAAISVQGTWAGTISAEMSVDGGTTWQATDIFGDSVTGETVTQTIASAAVGNYTFTNVSGVYAIRVRGNTVTSGSATISIRGNQVHFSYPTYIADNAGTLPTYGAMIAGSDGSSSRYVNINAKGTQGAYGVAVQQLKDSGRNPVNYFMVKPIVSTNTDTLQSLTGYKSSAAVGATTTPAVVTSGKTYRITSIQLAYVSLSGENFVVFTLRANSGGVVAIGSPAVNAWTLGAPAASAAGVTNSMNIDIPDGIEFPAGTGVGVSVLGYNSTAGAANAGYAQISINGYEY